MKKFPETPLRAFLLALCLGGCAPYQTVRPYPDFIRSGVDAGDQVRIKRTDGTALTSRVLRIDQHQLVTEDAAIPLPEIAEISRRGWSEPTPACGGGKPLECSIPTAVDLLTERLDEAKKLFKPACVQHDFCYRHGAATYGKSRRDCDGEFKRLMEDACRNQNFLAQVNWVTNPASCRTLAVQVYRAVRRHGADRFVQKPDSYCEYDGPPPAKTVSSTVGALGSDLRQY